MRPPRAPSRPAALLGAGGHARSVADALQRRGIRVALVIAPDADAAWGRVIRDDTEGLALATSMDLSVLLAMGDNRVRLHLASIAAREGISLDQLLATTATCADDAVLGDGTVVLEHAHVGPASVVAEAVIVNTGATVEHDARIGPGSHVGPGAILGGAVTLGAEVLIGAGAVVLPGVAIGDHATVGAGCVVHRDVEAGDTVVGVPARPV